jgi:hypothetical protein
MELFLFALGILFIGLKLTKHIDWPWIWVLAPIWMPIALVLMMWLFVWSFLISAAMMGG